MPPQTDEPSEGAAVNRPSIGGHLAIMRVDHWFKNVFILPGIVVALTISDDTDHAGLFWRIVIGFLAMCLVASSNYVINEVLDADYDKHHPLKRLRPVPSGLVSIPAACVQWLVLVIVAVGLGLLVSNAFALIVMSLWAMGCIYNIPPLRSKDRAYLDVLSESVNNPIRMLAGWYMVGPDAVTPISLLLSYWLIGCYFMAIKRYSEYRYIGDETAATTYRKSFGHYTESRLLTSIMFYASAAMLFLGVFVMRYRLEIVLSFPMIALVMASYLNLGLQSDSPAQRPESLYREPGLMIACGLCTVGLILCLYFDMPWLADLVTPLAPTR